MKKIFYILIFNTIIYAQCSPIEVALHMSNADGWMFPFSAFYNGINNAYSEIYITNPECYDLLENDGFFLSCCFGKNTDGFGTGKKMSENTYTNIKGVLSNGGVQSFFSKEELTSIFNGIGFNVEYYENILEDRNGELVEKHITCLTK